jgi:hypothetical protein
MNCSLVSRDKTLRSRYAFHLGFICRTAGDVTCMSGDVGGGDREDLPYSD